MAKHWYDDQKLKDAKLAKKLNTIVSKLKNIIVDPNLDINDQLPLDEALQIVRRKRDKYWPKSDLTRKD